MLDTALLNQQQLAAVSFGLEGDLVSDAHNTGYPHAEVSPEAKVKGPQAIESLSM